MYLFLLSFLAVLLSGPAVAAGGAVAYRIVNARAIPDSLTGRPGDPQAGRALSLDEKLARCAGCHGVPGEAAPRRDGTSGGTAPEAPPLGRVGDRLDEGTIRLWLVAPQVIAPGTRMPAFYAVGQRDDPADPRFGGPLLTAAEIENLVAYLSRRTGGTGTGQR
jgi:L-cysteine S-thiosulfotransferase